VDATGTGAGARSGARAVAMAGRPRPGFAFIPACMSREDLAGWLRHNAKSMLSADDRRQPPCADCTEEYAAEMRALGRCNGRPGWTWRPGWSEGAGSDVRASEFAGARPAPSSRARGSATGSSIRRARQPATAGTADPGAR
jgi:hypothetical protein